MRRLRGHAGVAGAALVGLILFCALWPELSPYGANHVDFDLSLQSPSFAHPLGTDQFGRDLLTRLAAAGRVSLAITAGALAIILALGFAYGAIAGLGVTAVAIAFAVSISSTTAMSAPNCLA